MKKTIKNFFTKKVLILYAFLLTYNLNSFGQKFNWYSYWEPEFYVTKKFNDTYSASFGIRERNFFDHPQYSPFYVREIDFLHTSAFKIHKNVIVAAGFMLREADAFILHDSKGKNFSNSGNTEIRFTQDVIHKIKLKKNEKWTIENRFRIDERFYTGTGENAIHYRYRPGVSYELWQNKEKHSALALKLKVEIIAQLNYYRNIPGVTFRSNAPEIRWDNRTTPTIDWTIKKGINFELGFEHRFESFQSNSIDWFVMMLSRLTITI